MSDSPIRISSVDVPLLLRLASPIGVSVAVWDGEKHEIHEPADDLGPRLEQLRKSISTNPPRRS